MQKVDYVVMACVALALILVGVSFLPSGPTQQALDDAYYKACEQLKKTCDDGSVISISALTTGNTVYTLGNICAEKGFTNSVTCANSCGCNATGAGSAVFSTPLKSFSDNPVTEGISLVDEEPLDEEIYDETV